MKFNNYCIYFLIACLLLLTWVFLYRDGNNVKTQKDQLEIIQQLIHDRHSKMNCFDLNTDKSVCKDFRLICTFDKQINECEIYLNDGTRKYVKY
jgi:hypothetical protein